jgi:hypothetical protein
MFPKRRIGDRKFCVTASENAKKCVEPARHRVTRLTVYPVIALRFIPAFIAAVTA